ncbi:hypothetical protein B9Z55_027984 [Caenorhabditis nigoni]|uniref:Uncharacterized protein n=1 Tax=Caenorhabditis nigoni TaxID=1611254 RepID=A0A2G5SE09_9PELO|nr:hypothetical protein B9Z55_027984 [Caenorhabditis nigoni]
MEVIGNEKKTNKLNNFSKNDQEESRSHPLSNRNLFASQIEKLKEVVIENRAMKKENDELKQNMGEIKSANAKVKNGIRQMKEEKEQLEV